MGYSLDKLVALADRIAEKDRIIGLTPTIGSVIDDMATEYRCARLVPPHRDDMVVAAFRALKLGEFGAVGGGAQDEKAWDALEWEGAS